MTQVQITRCASCGQPTHHVASRPAGIRFVAGGIQFCGACREDARRLTEAARRRARRGTDDAEP